MAGENSRPGQEKQFFLKKKVKKIDTCGNVFYILQNVKYNLAVHRGVIVCGLATS